MIFTTFIFLNNEHIWRTYVITQNKDHSKNIVFTIYIIELHIFLIKLLKTQEFLIIFNTPSKANKN